MAQETFDDVLLRAKRLTPEEQRQLVTALMKPEPAKETGGRPRTLYDAFSERGLIGSIRDVPADFATNPKYMEGFGEHADQ